MSILSAILLGLVQAATEFLPVSSTAHLLVFGELLGHDLADPRFRAFATIIQSGTTVAVLAYFRAELGALVVAGVRSLARGRPLETPESRLGWFIVLGTLPAAVAGKLLEARVEALGNWVSGGSRTSPRGTRCSSASARPSRSSRARRAPAPRSPPACSSASPARPPPASASSSRCPSSSGPAPTSSGRPSPSCAARRSGRSPRRWGPSSRRSPAT